MTWRSGLDAACDYFNETWLAFTRRTMQQVPIHPNLTDLTSECRQIIDELEGIARDRQITFDCEGDGTAWDEHRIVQAISNLASKLEPCRIRPWSSAGIEL